MATEWELARSAGQCSATGRDLKEGDAFYAAVFETPAGLERRDYSVEAWTGPPEGCFCYWRGRIPVREKRAATLEIDPQMLTQLFVSLEEEPSEAKQRFRFVLALLLMRKRVLRFEQATRAEGVECWQMRLMADKSLHQVVNPRLSDEQISRLSAQLTALLSGDLEAIEMMDDGGTAAIESGEHHAVSTTEGDGEPAQRTEGG